MLSSFGSDRAGKLHGEAVEQDREALLDPRLWDRGAHRGDGNLLEARQLREVGDGARRVDVQMVAREANESGALGAPDRERRGGQPDDHAGQPARVRLTGMWIMPARTRGERGLPDIGRRIGVMAAEADVAATSANTAESNRRRRKVPQGSRTRLESAPMFEGKNALILGVANKRSIAWAIAQRLADGGAELAFTFQGERIEKNVRELAESVASPLVTELDVRDDAAIARVFAEVGAAFGGKLDILVHSVAFAAAEDLEGRFTDTPRDRFWMAIDVSAYSLVAHRESRRAAARGRRRRLGRDDDLSRRRAGGAALQRDGRCQGDARFSRQVPRLGSR